MARTFNGTNDSLEGASAPVTEVPLTMACWFYPVTTAGLVLVALDTASGTDRFQMGTVPQTFPVTCAAVEGGTAPSANITGSIAFNTWHHAAAVFSSTSNRRVYLNGTAGSINAGLATPAGINRLNIGARYAPSLSGFYQGRIADVGIWNGALNADEIAALAKGVSADQIRPSALVFYAPLIRDIHDLRGGLTISEMGTGTIFSDHPRIIL